MRSKVKKILYPIIIATVALSVAEDQIRANETKFHTVPVQEKLRQSKIDLFNKYHRVYLMPFVTPGPNQDNGKIYFDNRGVLLGGHKVGCFKLKNCEGSVGKIVPKILPRTLKKKNYLLLAFRNGFAYSLPFFSGSKRADCKSSFDIRQNCLSFGERVRFFWGYAVCRVHNFIFPIFTENKPIPVAPGSISFVSINYSKSKPIKLQQRRLWYLIYSYEICLKHPSYSPEAKLKKLPVYEAKRRLKHYLKNDPSPFGLKPYLHEENKK